MSRATSPRLLAALIFASFLAPYLISTMPRLSLPGLSAEEAQTALPVLGNAGVEYLSLGPLKLPLNMHNYQGPMESYLSVPFLLVFGRTPEALRLCTIFFGAATLALVYLFCLEFFEDKRTAWACAFLVATAPAFISGTRFGLSTASMLLFFEAASALCLLRWRRTERASYLYSSAFLFGVAMACRLAFGIFLGALGITGLIVFAPLLRRLAQRPLAAFRRASMCLLLFLLGALPMTLFVLLHTNRLQAVHIDPEANNLRYVEKLRVRAAEMVDVWGGDPFTCDAFPASNCHAAIKLGGAPWAPEFPAWTVESRINWIWTALPLASLLWLALSGLFSRRPLSREPGLGLVLFAAAYWLCSPVTIGAFRPDHVLPGLLPLLAAVAAALVDLVERAGASWRASVKAALVFFVVVALRGLDTSSLQGKLATMNGAAPYYSDAVNPLSRWLLANVHEPMLVDFGLDNPLHFLTNDSLPRVMVVGDAHEGETNWDGMRSARIYAAYLPEENKLAMWEGRRYAIERLGKKASLLREFRNHDGRPVIGVYFIPDGLGNVRSLLVPRRQPALALAGPNVHA
jgi:hypothetical protein